MAQIRVVMDGNEVKCAIPGDMTVEEAKLKLASFIASLGKEITFTQTSEIEAHRHEPDEVKARDHSHAG